MSVYFDTKRPAADGKWVAIHKGDVIITYTTHKTEEEAHEAVKGNNASAK